MARQGSSPSVPPSISVLAIHDEVAELLNEWSREHNYKRFSARIQALIDCVISGESETARAIYGQLNTCRIKGSASTILEHRAVQKGGAPRLFEMPACQSHIFVSAGIEKTRTGCAALQVAQRRVEAIRKALKGQTILSSISDFHALLGSQYRISIIPAPILYQQ